MRQIDTRKTAVSPVVGVILMIALAVILSAVVSNFGLQLVDILEKPITGGVDITETVNQQQSASAVTVTVTWTADGTSERLTVVAGGTRADLTEIGQSVSVSGLTAGDTVKILGTLESGRQGVTQIHTVDAKK